MPLCPAHNSLKRVLRVCMQSSPGGGIKSLRRPQPSEDAQKVLDEVFPLISNLRNACEVLRAENGALETELLALKEAHGRERARWEQEKNALVLRLESQVQELRTLRGMQRVESMGAHLRELRFMALGGGGARGDGAVAVSPPRAGVERFGSQQCGSVAAAAAAAAGASPAGAQGVTAGSLEAASMRLTPLGERGGENLAHPPPPPPSLALSNSVRWADAGSPAAAAASPQAAARSSSRASLSGNTGKVALGDRASSRTALLARAKSFLSHTLQ